MNTTPVDAVTVYRDEPAPDSLFTNPTVRDLVAAMMAAGDPPDRIVDRAAAADPGLRGPRNRLWMLTGVSALLFLSLWTVNYLFGGRATAQAADIVLKITMICAVAAAAYHYLLHAEDSATRPNTGRDRLRYWLNGCALHHLTDQERANYRLCREPDRPRMRQRLTDLSELRTHLAAMPESRSDAVEDACRKLVAAATRAEHDIARMVDDQHTRQCADQDADVLERLNRAGGAVAAALNDPEPGIVLAPTATTPVRWETYPGGGHASDQP